MGANYKECVIFGVIALAVAILLGLFLYVESFQIGPDSQTPETGSPERLRIPSIGVDAVMERVALTPSGAMDTPKGPQNVGWYSPGPYPGQEGSAVMAGHRGWKNGQPAVFDDLDQLREGDLVAVTDSQGNEYSFVVREMRRYSKDSVTPEVFTSSSGTHLNLITCIGVWDNDLQSREERLVVFTDLAL